MEHAMRLIHWYDLECRRIACGAQGHSNSTKHHRDVTCTACLACLEDRRTSVRLVPSSAPMQ